MALGDSSLMLRPTEFSLTDTIALLSRTPAAVNELLCGLPEIWARSNEGNDTWSAFDVVGHLICAERTDWMPRVRLILETGETRPFEPFAPRAPIKANGRTSLGSLL